MGGLCRSWGMLSWAEIASCEISNAAIDHYEFALALHGQRRPLSSAARSFCTVVPVVAGTGAALERAG